MWLFLSSSNLMVSLGGQLSSCGWPVAYLHWVVLVLQTEGNVVEMSVSDGTVRDLGHVVLVHWRTSCKYCRLYWLRKGPFISGYLGVDCNHWDSWPLFPGSKVSGPSVWPGDRSHHRMDFCRAETPPQYKLPSSSFKFRRGVTSMHVLFWPQFTSTYNRQYMYNINSLYYNLNESAVCIECWQTWNLSSPISSHVCWSILKSAENDWFWSHRLTEKIVRFIINNNILRGNQYIVIGILFNGDFFSAFFKVYKKKRLTY